MVSKILSFVRQSFYIYVIARKLAKFICKFIYLEDGFKILDYVMEINHSSAIDIGCNDGTSIAMIRKKHKKSIIHAFDPISLLSSVDKRTIFRQVALGSKKQKTVLFTPVYKRVAFYQYSSIYKNDMVNQFVNDTHFSRDKISVESDEVSTEVLDDFGLNPFLIKIDVEGFELEILRGSPNTIRKYKPILILEIQEQKQFDSIKKYLIHFNYFCLDLKIFIDKLILQENKFQLDTNNYVWLPRNKSITWEWLDNRRERI